MILADCAAKKITTLLKAFYIPDTPENFPVWS
jgi:hypothetical protein